LPIVQNRRLFIKPFDRVFVAKTLHCGLSFWSTTAFPLDGNAHGLKLDGNAGETVSSSISFGTARAAAWIERTGVDVFGEECLPCFLSFAQEEAKNALMLSFLATKDSRFIIGLTGFR
jgi:hypothetical protein